MYGKIFEQIFDGTLATKGPWEALVTFQQLIVLADKLGVVDMTAAVIARRTTIPLEIIEKGIAVLEQPDPHSRTPDEGGRRIVRLSDSRPWGWQIVNHAKYRGLRSQEERRDYMRQYQRQRRAAKDVNQDVNIVNNINPSSKQKAKSKRESGEPRSPDAIPLPKDFWPSDDDMKFWLDHGMTKYQIEESSFKFVNHYRANGERRVDWRACWLKWLTTDCANLRKPKQVAL